MSKMTKKVKEIIDDVAGAGHADVAEGKVKEVIGKTKQAAGKVTKDKKLEAEGEAEEGEGKVQQIAGNVKEAAETLGEAVAEGARKVGAAVKHAIHKD